MTYTITKIRKNTRTQFQPSQIQVLSNKITSFKNIREKVMAHAIGIHSSASKSATDAVLRPDPPHSQTTPRPNGTNHEQRISHRRRPEPVFLPLAPHHSGANGS